jgi:hypothetical protein
MRQEENEEPYAIEQNVLLDNNFKQQSTIEQLPVLASQSYRELIDTNNRSATISMEHSTTPSAEVEDRPSAEPEEAGRLEEDRPWSGLDKFVVTLILFAVWGPIFAAVLLPLLIPDDFEFNPARALSITSGILIAYVLAMARLSRRSPLAYLESVYWTMLIYGDMFGPLAFLLLIPHLLGLSKEGPYAIAFYTLVPMVGWLFLVLVGRGIILRTHDYSFSETMPRSEGDTRDHDRRFEAILKRGIAENAFRYKYVPKTHLMLISCVSIFVGIVFSSVIWLPSLAITLPVSLLCLVDLFYGCCFRDDDPQEEGYDVTIATTQEEGDNDTVSVASTIV